MNIAFVGLLAATCGAWRVPGPRRPAPPDVDHLVPALRWENAVDHARHRVTRTRRHAGFRVHLRGPWPSSGGELLAVVLGPTRCATDPLTPANFPNAELTASVLLAEPVNGAPASAPITAFTPSRDPELGLWTCDIDIDAAHCSRILLALARYRPRSAAGLTLSGITTTGFLPLLPDRTTTATMTSTGAIRLELSGPVSSNALGARVGTGRAAMAASRRVLAAVERRAAGGGDLDWAGTGTVLELTCVPTPRSYLWSADLIPPAPQLLPPSEYRLLIEEYEVYATDPATATGTVTAGGTAVPVGQRLVHADRLGLTVSPAGRLVLRE
ncbi:hypothetical protein I5Q34_13375 [Streptomyces sp. AV19]|uniref:hypothetical protein n=1 Tax=Streptomyces sp. AV19 TaxID=2793068 RepID=UPI0018FEEB22|nr:hypothetical protein [Streptomyces sp. AV19]MBH1935252.1 hypothetical protein [Streptomyces sp. AV19]MDG4532068.1 hypothetical protein [Streptomyces sp. AV19]